MTKKRTVDLAYALSLYAALSVLCMTVQFFLSGALVYLLSRFAHPALAAGKAHFFGPSLCDSLGFAFLTLTNTVLQYFLASLMVHDLPAQQSGGSASGGKDRSALFAILTLCAVLSTALFVRLSAHSVFGSYMFAALPLIFSYLLGGVTGLLQKEEENPVHRLKIRIFKID